MEMLKRGDLNRKVHALATLLACHTTLDMLILSRQCENRLLCEVVISCSELRSAKCYSYAMACQAKKCEFHSK